MASRTAPRLRNADIGGLQKEKCENRRVITSVEFTALTQAPWVCVKLNLTERTVTHISRLSREHVCKSGWSDLPPPGTPVHTYPYRTTRLRQVALNTASCVWWCVGARGDAAQHGHTPVQDFPHMGTRERSRADPTLIPVWRENM